MAQRSGLAKPHSDEQVWVSLNAAMQHFETISMRVGKRIGHVLVIPRALQLSAPMFARIHTFYVSVRFTPGSCAPAADSPSLVL
jgi:hypothetical protein